MLALTQIEGIGNGVAPCHWVTRAPALSIWIFMLIVSFRENRARDWPGRASRRVSKHSASSSWCTWGFHLRARCCQPNLSLHFQKDTSPLQVPRRMRGDVLLLGFWGFVPTALWDPKWQASGPQCPASGHYKALLHLHLPFPWAGPPRGLSFTASTTPHTVAGGQGQSWSKDWGQGWEGNWDGVTEPVLVLCGHTSEETRNWEFILPVKRTQRLGAFLKTGQGDASK